MATKFVTVLPDTQVPKLKVQAEAARLLQFNIMSVHTCLDSIMRYYSKVKNEVTKLQPSPGWTCYQYRASEHIILVTFLNSIKTGGCGEGGCGRNYVLIKLNSSSRTVTIEPTSAAKTATL